MIKSLQRIAEGNKLIEKTNSRLEKLKEENLALEKQVEITKSDEFIEKQLRDKLGLVKEGEIILVLPEDEVVKKFSPNIPESDSVKPKANWQKWLDIFR